MKDIIFSQWEILQREICSPKIGKDSYLQEDTVYFTDDINFLIDILESYKDLGITMSSGFGLVLVCILRTQSRKLEKNWVDLSKLLQ